ncbi:MAG: F0F1 ATP synthase subunit epsilon [Muribaculaceae bacterium]|nr:F0F1 ATP synthase subunit epsilon [Muribaculaceae bacterium]
MTLKIISTTEVLFEGEVSLVSLPGTLGRFTVLNNHASLISTLTSGKIGYKTGDNVLHDNGGYEGEFEIKGGIADIDNNIISVCVY